MADSDRIREIFSLEEQILVDIKDLEKDISCLPSGELSRDLYRDYMHRFNYIQRVFDRCENLFREVSFDQSNPDLFRLLECRENISANYGSFRRMLGDFSRQYGKDELNREELSRERSIDESRDAEMEEESAPEEPVFLQDPGIDFPPEDIGPELAIMNEAEAAKRRQDERMRQVRLAEENKAREVQFHRQEQYHKTMENFNRRMEGSGYVEMEKSHLDFSGRSDHDSPSISEPPQINQPQQNYQDFVRPTNYESPRPSPSEGYYTAEHNMQHHEPVYTSYEQTDRRYDAPVGDRDVPRSDSTYSNPVFSQDSYKTEGTSPARSPVYGQYSEPPRQTGYGYPEHSATPSGSQDYIRPAEPVKSYDPVPPPTPEKQQDTHSHTYSQPSYSTPAPEEPEAREQHRSEQRQRYFDPQKLKEERAVQTYPEYQPKPIPNAPTPEPKGFVYTSDRPAAAAAFGKFFKSSYDFERQQAKYESAPESPVKVHTPPSFDLPQENYPHTVYPQNAHVSEDLRQREASWNERQYQQEQRTSEPSGRQYVPASAVFGEKGRPSAPEQNGDQKPSYSDTEPRPVRSEPIRTEANIIRNSPTSGYEGQADQKVQAQYPPIPESPRSREASWSERQHQQEARPSERSAQPYNPISAVLGQDGRPVASKQESAQHNVLHGPGRQVETSAVQNVKTGTPGGSEPAGKQPYSEIKKDAERHSAQYVPNQEKIVPGVVPASHSGLRTDPTKPRHTQFESKPQDIRAAEPRKVQTNADYGTSDPGSYGQKPYQPVTGPDPHKPDSRGGSEHSYGVNHQSNQAAYGQSNPNQAKPVSGQPLKHDNQQPGPAVKQTINPSVDSRQQNHSPVQSGSRIPSGVGVPPKQTAVPNDGNKFGSPKNQQSSPDSANRKEAFDQAGKRFQYVPGGTTEWKVLNTGERPQATLAKLKNNAPIVSTDNSKVYAAVKAGSKSSEGRPQMISPAFEAQMRYNLETAKLNYHAKRGTAEATSAMVAYREQRKSFMAFKKDINEGRIQVEKPKVMETKAASRPTPDSINAKAASVHCSYTPTGIYSQMIENAKPSGSNVIISRNPKRDNLKYSRSNPLIVSPAYEEALKSRADRASAAMNNAVVATKARGQAVQLKPGVNQEVTLSTTAYIAFQRAKQNGEVIIRKDSTHNTPDFSGWSQRYYVPTLSRGGGNGGGPGGGGGKGPKNDSKNRRRRKNDNEAEGKTGQANGVNPNKVSKEAVEERVANIFGKSVKLKRETVVTRYSRNFGYKIEGYGTMAIARASRKVYNWAQSGDEDGSASIRTFEQGRYYLKTSMDIRDAIIHFHVADSKGALHRGIKTESKFYGRFHHMTEKELSTHIHENIKNNRALKKEIKELWAKGSALTIAERKELLSKTAQLSKSSLEATQAVSYRKLVRKNKNTVAAAKKLETDRKVVTTRKQVDKTLKEIRSDQEKKMAKKFGNFMIPDEKNPGKHISIMTLNEKSLKLKINQMIKQGKDLKLEIKLLQSKGSALTASERKLLSSLMAKHKELGKELKKLTGLRDARRNLNEILASYTDMRRRIIKNANAWSNGLYALYGFALKPIREGAETGAQGLAKAADIATNRHVRKVVAKVWKAEMKFSRWAGRKVAQKTGLDKATKAVTGAAKKAVVNSAPVQGIKTGAQASSAAIKTAARATKNTAVNLTPNMVKTAASKTIATKNLMQEGILATKKRVANSVVGRVYSSVSRGFSRAMHGVRTALSFAKGLLIKVGLGAIAAILLFSLLVNFVEVIFSATSSVIMGTDTKNEMIDLGPYAKIIEKRQEKFEAEITALREDDKYDDVNIEYTTTTSDNTREMLSMMAVYLGQDLDLVRNSKVKEYLNSLYDDSHFYTTRVEKYKCSGCDYKTVSAPHNDDCPEDCTIEHTKEKKYCPGHKRLHITITILGMDEIFTADTMGNVAGTATKGDLIGRATITYYCAEKYPHICNAGPPYKTATGTTPTPGRTIAVDPDQIRLGSHVIIDGHEYIAEDTGGAIDGLDIDILVETHEEALAKGTRRNVAVYKVAYEGGGVQETGVWQGWTEDNIEWCRLIYSQDWTELYTGIDNVTDIVGNESDFSGVEFIDGERPGNENIVNIAMSQLGNAGGRPYWSWYGFSSRVEWCATFVSWCANKDGSLNDAIPKFASCSIQGVPWFKENGQWAKRGDITPVAGDIIFFDWQPDGRPDHVGIVAGTDGTKVYTVEGNSRDQVRTKSYALNSKNIFGYGLPNY